MKRMMSLILVIAMLMSMVPAVFAAETVTGENDTPTVPTVIDGNSQWRYYCFSSICNNPLSCLMQNRGFFYSLRRQTFCRLLQCISRGGN